MPASRVGTLGLIAQTAMVTGGEGPATGNSHALDVQQQAPISKMIPLKIRTQFGAAKETIRTRSIPIWVSFDQVGRSMRISMTNILSSTSMETSLLYPANTDPSGYKSRSIRAGSVSSSTHLALRTKL